MPAKVPPTAVLQTVARSWALSNGTGVVVSSARVRRVPVSYGRMASSSASSSPQSHSMNERRIEDWNKILGMNCTTLVRGSLTLPNYRPYITLTAYRIMPGRCFVH
ncbi:hypothetical protein SeMB42_g00738 [Synchytrium endobioticum]|uniref:Uncharacterized protein n=1 Tax=Synchytrium endobioticum TaxID=286115 RepID=A0A507DPR1_9FUNG|nr:hypothetical protein SeMB42_g00738 [Synchytrium endobioticum]